VTAITVTRCDRRDSTDMRYPPSWSADESLLIKTGVALIWTFCAPEAGRARHMILLGPAAGPGAPARVYRTCRIECAVSRILLREPACSLVALEVCSLCGKYRVWRCHVHMARPDREVRASP
jgi:hypothetical protein